MLLKLVEVSYQQLYICGLKIQLQLSYISPDINECDAERSTSEISLNICSINETCLNTQGSFICICIDGYFRKSDGKGCEGM